MCRRSNTPSCTQALRDQSKPLANIDEDNGSSFEGDYMGPIVVPAIVDDSSDAETRDHSTDRVGRKPSLRCECAAGEGEKPG